MHDLRLYLRMNKITIVSISKVLGVDKRTVFRWLNYYDKDHHEKILNAIKQLESEK